MPSRISDETDLSLLSLTLYYKDQGDSVQIASFDKSIYKVSGELNIDFIQDDEIQLILQLFPKNK